MCEVSGLGTSASSLSVTYYALLSTFSLFLQHVIRWEITLGVIWCAQECMGPVVMTIVTVLGTVLAVHLMGGVGAEQMVLSLVTSCLGRIRGWEVLNMGPGQGRSSIQASIVASLLQHL